MAKSETKNSEQKIDVKVKPKAPAATKVRAAPKDTIPAPTAEEQHPGPTRHHLIRRWLSAFLGFIAVSLILASILFGWVNYTLVNSRQYMATVGPLASQPQIQAYLVKATADSILNNNPPPELAAKLKVKLPASASDDMQRAQLRPLLEATLAQVIGSPQAAVLWRQANQSAHNQLINLIKSDSPRGSLDFKPTIVGLVNLLKNTPLNFLNFTDISVNNAKVDVPADQLTQLRKTYHASQNGIKLLIGLAVLTSVAAVLAANHRLKTIRHLAFWTSLGLALIILAINLPTHLSLTNVDPTAKAAVVAGAKTIFSSLARLCWILLAFGLAVTVGISAWLWFAGRRVAKT